jgi:hypothetical protein
MDREVINNMKSRQANKRCSREKYFVVLKINDFEDNFCHLGINGKCRRETKSPFKGFTPLTHSFIRLRAKD